MSLDRVRMMPQPYSTEKLVYSLSNYTCNGTSSTGINTGLRLFNATDYPYGFKLEFSGTAAINPSSLPYGLGTWLGCMDETGSPWPGFVVRHDRNKQTLDMSINAASGTILQQDKTANSGTTVNITFTYNRSIFTKIVDGVSSSASGNITHNFPLCVGGTLQTETTWFSDRFGYVKVNSLKVYKLLPKKSNITYGNFGGLMFTPGPLVYENGDYRVQETWNEANSFGTIQGAQEGSTYFSFVDVGRRFDSRGSSFSTSSGDINNGNPLSFDKFNDWRIPTQSDIKLLIGTYLYEGKVDGTHRNGSTVNGVSNKHFSVITTNLSYAGNTSSNISGFLIFPDGKTITGKTLSGYDNFTKTAGFTNNDIDTYLKQGCLFFPESGLYYNYAWSSRQGRFSSLTATSDPTSSSRHYIVGFGTEDDGYLDAHSSLAKTSSQYRFLVYLCRTI